MKYIFSMKMAVFMLFSFGALVGIATFIENDYGTQTARALIYKAQWFELFLAYFVAILVYNIIKYKNYKTKPAVFLFHFSFLVIALGALVTRYIGYEGVMHIREGASSHTMVSDVKILQVQAKHGDKSATYEKELYFSTMTGNSLTQSLSVGDKEVNVELLKYMPTAYEKVIASPDGKKLLELKISTGQKGEMYYLAKGERKDFGGFYVGYDVKATSTKPTFLIREEGAGYKVDFPFVLQTLNMNDRSSAELNAGENEFKNRMLYRFGENAIVLKDVHEKAIVKLGSDDIKTQRGQAEYMQWKVSVGDKSKIITTRPYQGRTGKVHR
ncbi:MAG: cytochrome c biogenesis protein ResB, partial [Sulfurovum sp.]|nr:cytochrome c biogenesis protein ResB [Sulfurovum sp.]